MNALNREKQVAVISALTEGCSIRSTSRMTGVDRETVGVLLKKVGDGCEHLLDDTMRNLPLTRLELDELWSFVGKKQRHVKMTDSSEMGDCWTWLAIDADTKLIPTFLVGKRTDEDAKIFVTDLRSRLASGDIQVSTDGLRAYVKAIDDAFAGDAVNYAQVKKSYVAEAIGAGRYSPPAVSGVDKTPIIGAPVDELVSTSYVERVNLSVRMMGRRYTRLTNAFSKRFDMHVASTALTLAAYNFVRQHKTIRCSPAMAAGVAPTLWSVNDLVEAALDGVRP